MFKITTASTSSGYFLLLNIERTFVYNKNKCSMEMTFVGKLNGNGRYESSRFVLPEHREALLMYQHERTRLQRPELDEQEWEQIGSRLQQSMAEREKINVRLFDPFARKEVNGIVVDIDIHRRRFKLDEETQWINFEDVLEVVL